MTANLVAIYQSRLLLDVAAVAADGTGYLVTVDHSAESAEPLFGALSEKMTLRFWRPERDGAAFHEVPRGTTAMPSPAAVAMTLANGRLIALAEINEPLPAILLSWETAGHPPKLPESHANAFLVELRPAEAGQVHLDAAQRWNTRRLSCAGWLFRPSLSALPDSDEAALAMNTADAHAIVWMVDGFTPPGRPVAFVPDSLDPVFTRVAGKSYLLSRRAPAHWPVYYNDPVYSGSVRPVSLPLIMAEVNASGAVVQSHDLSREQSIGNVFGFAAASGGGSLVVAAIAGDEKRPELRVYSSANGEKLALRAAAPVRRVPYRLTLAEAGGSALVGLAYPGKEGLELEGMVAPLR